MNTKLTKKEQEAWSFIENLKDIFTRAKNYTAQLKQALTTAIKTLFSHALGYIVEKLVEFSMWLATA